MRQRKRSKQGSSRMQHPFAIQYKTGARQKWRRGVDPEFSVGRCCQREATHVGRPAIIACPRAPIARCKHCVGSIAASPCSSGALG
eukprot:5617071-Pyramimonas_sp.AAC.1